MPHASVGPVLDFVIVVNGVPGAGKTTLARPLARALRVPLLAKDAIKEAVNKLQKDMDDQSADTHRSLLGLEAKINACNKAIVTTSGSIVSFAPRVEVPKPTPFEGKREARAVDDFL